jgi:integrase
MSLELHKVRVRAAFKVRPHPYWGPAIADDLAVGFRKISAEQGTWIARMRSAETEGPRYLFKSLGLVTAENDYEAARAEALSWRKARDAGVSDEVVTVAQACEQYVADRKREKGAACAHDARKRFERTVYGARLGALALTKLRTPHLKAWRDGLKLSKGSADRTRTVLVAALNLAVANRLVSADAAREWADFKPHGATGKRRDVFLDRDQRRALLNRVQGGLRDLIEAATLTGARAGELTSATRSQFDARTGSMTFIGKTGRRDVPLSPAAQALFERLSCSKLPAASLFVRDDGRRWAHSDWDELIAEASQLARLPDGVCLYTLRHSFITEAITGGMSTLDVARLAGTSLQMIEKHYGHLVASHAREKLATVKML